MTPKEARALIREKIRELREDQILCKADLSKPHTEATGLVMGKSAVNAAGLTSYHNALNELCGRKQSHVYKDKSAWTYDGGAAKHCKEIKALIVWPEPAKTESV